MLRFAILGLAVFGVSACDPLTFGKLNEVDDLVVTCATNPGGGCTYNLAPLRVLPEPVTLPRRPYKFFPTAETLTFVDARGRTWVAPRRTLTDGASIPKIFTSIVGDPTSPTFINAAAVHDAYCGIGNEQGDNFHQADWEDVHQMFYDGLIVGGTQETIAKLMFAAVWLGGPRWETYRKLDQVPVGRLQQTMRSTKTFIQQNNPSMGKLKRFLQLRERELLAEFPVSPVTMHEESEPEVEDEYDYEGSYGECSTGDCGSTAGSGGDVFGVGG